MQKIEFDVDIEAKTTYKVHSVEMAKSITKCKRLVMDKIKFMRAKEEKLFIHQEAEMEGKQVEVKLPAKVKTVEICTPEKMGNCYKIEYSVTLVSSVPPSEYPNHIS